MHLLLLSINKIIVMVRMPTAEWAVTTCDNLRESYILLTALKLKGKI